MAATDLNKTDVVQVIEAMPGNVALFSAKLEVLAVSDAWKRQIKLDEYLAHKEFKTAWDEGVKKSFGIPCGKFEELIFFKNARGEDDCCRLLMSPWEGRSVLVILEHSDFHREILSELDQVKTLQASKAHYEEMGEMAGGLAHEINNPLTVVLLKSLQMRKILQSDVEDLNRKQMLDSTTKIVTQTERIAKIVKGLMNFSRDASADPVISCKLVTLIEESIALCSEKIRYSAAEVEIGKISPDEMVYCRPVQLMQVLVNLVNNACDALVGRHEPKIYVDSRNVDGFLDILVRDSGPGIPEKIEQKIFKPFFTTKEAGKGSGLGLSISYGIISKHGGKLFLDRSVSNSCFVIRMPREERVHGNY